MNKNCRGLTLVELILTIIIIAICFIPVSVIYQQVLGNAHRTRVIAVAESLASSKLDEVLGDGFASVSDESSTSFSSPFTDYSYEVEVDYVAAADLTTAVVGPTEYKRIEVKVTHSEIGTMTLTSLLTSH